MMRIPAARSRKAQIYALSMIGTGYDLHLKLEINQHDIHPKVEARISSGGDDRFISQLYHGSVIRIQDKNYGRIG